MQPSSPTRAADAFRRAFAERDFAPAAAVLADDVAFRSPVLHEPWRTRSVLERLGPAIVAVLEDVTFQDTLAAERRAVVPFKARRDGHQVEGVLVLDVDEDGAVAEMAMLLRPLAALQVVAAGMSRLVDPELLAQKGVASSTSVPKGSRT